MLTYTPDKLPIDSGREPQASGRSTPQTDIDYRPLYKTLLGSSSSTSVALGADPRGTRLQNAFIVLLTVATKQLTIRKISFSDISAAHVLTFCHRVVSAVRQTIFDASFWISGPAQAKQFFLLVFISTLER